MGLHRDLWDLIMVLGECGRQFLDSRKMPFSLGCSMPICVAARAGRALVPEPLSVTLRVPVPEKYSGPNGFLCRRFASKPAASQVLGPLGSLSVV